MKYSYNWLKDYIAGKMPEPKKLAEVLMGRSFEIDSVEKKGEDWVLDIKVLSNRAADCLSHIGIAREIAAVTNCKFQTFVPSSGRGIANFKLQENKNFNAKDFVNVRIEDKKDCSRYTASVILGVKVGDSPQWLKTRLKACGLQSINNIVDITNYVMLEMGQPLHAFDLNKIKGVEIRNPKSEILNKSKIQNSKIQKRTIIIRRAKRGEYIKTFDKEKTNIVLDENILVIADENKPVAIAGIKGGAETGIGKDTKDIIIEAANFNPVLIRRASQKIKIRTDASWRFENGLDLRLIDLAQKRVCYLIQQIAKGEIVNGLADVSVPLPKPKNIRLNPAHLNSLLGASIAKSVALKILQSLGCRILKTGADCLIIEAPSHRLDLKTPEDLIEEIGRVWGYEKLPKTFPVVALNVPLKNKDLFFENKAKDILASLGFCEAYNHTFIGEKEKATFGYQDNELLEIANPVSELNKFLRPNLMTHLLKNVKENLKNFSEVKMFEIGKVFSKKLGQQEKLHLGLVMAGKKQASEMFFSAKGVIEALLAELGVNNFTFTEILNPVAPVLLERLGIKEKVVLAEINFEQILERANEQKKYQPISIYPASLRDIAVLAPQETKAEDVLQAIKLAGGKLLVEVELFDIYSGANLPEGKKNLAFHLTYQSNEKTLLTNEVDEIQQKIFSAFETRGWQVRK